MINDILLFVAMLVGIYSILYAVYRIGILTEGERWMVKLGKASRKTREIVRNSEPEKMEEQTSIARIAGRIEVIEELMDGE